MEERQIELNNRKAKINYLVGGNGETNILFLHGWCINARYWEDQIKFFSKDFKVFALDLPGFGGSTANRKNWSIEEYTLDVLGFINELNLKNLILVGHSMSGAIMMEVVLKDCSNIIGIVGVDNFKFIDVKFTPEQKEQITSFFPLLEKDFPTHAPIYADNMLFHPSTSNEVKERVKSDFASANPTVGYNSFINLMNYSPLETIKLKSLPIKLDLINSNYPTTNEEGLKNNTLCGFNLKIIEESGHYPMIEKSNEFNNKLEEVIEEVVTKEIL